MAYGGSAGHAGAVALDIEEGRIQDGRFWQVAVSQLSEYRQQQEDEREQRKRDKEHRTRENNRLAVLRAMQRFPDGETKTQIRTAAGQNPQTFEPVFQDLITSQEIKPCDVEKQNHHGNLKTYPGYKLASKNTEEQ
jgi:hypothetical protein